MIPRGRTHLTQVVSRRELEEKEVSQTSELISKVLGP